MKEVMMCAQKLAEAILNSDVYQHMHTLEEQVTQDEDATKAIAAYMEKRTAVEQAMRKPDIDPTACRSRAGAGRRAAGDERLPHHPRHAGRAEEVSGHDGQREPHPAPCCHRRNGRRQRRSAHLRLHRQLRLLRRLPLIWEGKIIHEIMPLWVGNQASQPKSPSRPQQT